MYTVSPLKKVTLILEPAAGEVGEGEKNEINFTFIYGAASSGLCPFERQLAGVKTGERLSLSLAEEEVTGYFGHLYQALQKNIDLQAVPQRFEIIATVRAVEKAGEREILTAIKDSLGGGCGGNCGCGCH